WGENAAGTWTLKVIDTVTGDTGTLNSWSINVYGNGDAVNDQYVYTNEYASLASSGGRNVLNDTDGGRDTINAAAIASASTINLTTGTATLAGATLTIQNPGNVENVIGGEFNDTITGNAATNFLVGGRGNDTLSGGAGWDVLFGGQGNDTLTGGTDNDVFVIEKEAGSTDVINDFTPGAERIVLSGFGASPYSSLTFTQEGADTRVGLGEGQSLLLKNVTASTLSASSFVSIAEGLAPRDLMNYAGVLFGNDTAQAETTLPNDGYIYWAGDGGERVFGGTNNDAIYGGGGDDILVGENTTDGTSGGSDIIYGGAGNDVVRGGAGNDKLYGGAGFDYIGGDAGNDTVFLEGDQSVAGWDNTNIISASGTFYGMSYNLVGGSVAGVAGGSGNDRFVVVEDTLASASQGVMKNLIYDFEVTNANEKIDLSQIRAVKSFADLNFSNFNVNGDQILRVWLGPMAAGTQYISLYNLTADQLSADNFIFADADAYSPVSHPLIQGTSSNDTLIGDAGGQTLDGGLGADTMEGRTGDDTYIVDNVGDVVKEVAGGGYDSVKSSVTYTLPDEVEELTLTGPANINGTGNVQANRIAGNSGDNVLDGGGGSDVLIGGAGNDTYIVDDGADRVVENPGEGTDTVRSSVSFTLADNLENLTLTGTDAINGTGNALNNVLTGNSTDNKLDGAQGADTMAGGAGNDVYLVDNAGDVVYENANEGIDTVYATINYTLGAN
ncbi:MAG TPA: hypothetical protein DEA44_02655, partial [Firmicutes bacterium]|nr:hypothetical protein [Bacillota bacterium]